MMFHVSDMFPTPRSHGLSIQISSLESQLYSSVVATNAQAPGFARTSGI